MTTKKTTTEKTSVKKTKAPKKPGVKKKKAKRRRDGKGTIVFFMGKLIEAGYLGKDIPNDNKVRGVVSLNLRQMAEKLARQTRRFGDEDVGLGEED